MGGKYLSVCILKHSFWPVGLESIVLEINFGFNFWNLVYHKASLTVVDHYLVYQAVAQPVACSELDNVVFHA